MDTVLKDKNENSSGSPALGLSFLKSPENNDLAVNTSKENHNPKTLIEIASATTNILNLEPVTPKKNLNENTHDSNESLKENVDSENFNPQTMLEVPKDPASKWNLETTSTPLNAKNLQRMLKRESMDDSYNVDPAANQKNEHGLSFLLDGLNNMKLDTKADQSMSDDDEEFLSFNNQAVASQQNSIMETKNVADETKVIEDEKNKTTESHDQNLEDIQMPSHASEHSIESTHSETDSVQNKTPLAEEQTNFNKTEVIEMQTIQNQTAVVESQVPAIENKTVLNKTEVVEEKTSEVETEMPVAEEQTSSNKTEVIAEENLNHIATLQEETKPSDQPDTCEMKIPDNPAENLSHESLNNTEVLDSNVGQQILNKTEVTEQILSTPEEIDPNAGQQSLNKTEFLDSNAGVQILDKTELLDSNAGLLNKTEVLDLNAGEQSLNKTEVLDSNAGQLNLNKTEFLDANDGLQILNKSEVIDQSAGQLNLNKTEVFDSHAGQQILNKTEVIQTDCDRNESHNEQQVFNKTEVIQASQVLGSTFNAEAEAMNEDEYYASMDVTMKSICEPENTTIPMPEQVTSSREEMTKPLDNFNDFKFPLPPSITVNALNSVEEEQFTSAASYNFGDSDFDFLQKIGKTSPEASNIGRDSVLLKFDPLFERPVHQQKSALGLGRLSEAQEEDSFSDLVLKDFNIEPQQHSFELRNHSSGDSFATTDAFQQQLLSQSNNARDMNVDIMKDIPTQNDKIDSNLECEDIKLSSINSEDQSIKLRELENKLKMEAEQREEALLKRISEKDKQISKMNNVVEAYEKAIAELIAEKEQLIQSYEKKCNDLKGDSEMNAQHLASLESTFSDLHAKYERTKQIASELKDREESILQDRKTLQDNLKMQEARYEKMKTHAMAQLEIANNKLAEMLRNHSAEVTKLKAQLKKEEISRASVHEQLIQKSKENAELVKICDELIGNHGNSQTA